MSDPRTTLVGAGYDAMADTWENWSSQVNDDPRNDWLEELLAMLPADARVVELGCGNGTRETRELAMRTRLTCVDLSEEQLRRARERVPGASDLPDWEGEWLGVPMFFSGHAPQVNVRLLREAGFELVHEEPVTITEPEGAVPFHWVLARR